MSEPDLQDPQYYFNRETSWLRFNERVLEEAEDSDNPPLERLKFLAIFSTNLDEFMMIRYAGLKEQVAAGIVRRSFDGLTPAEQLRDLSAELHPMIARHRKVLRHDVLPLLERHGVSLVPMNKLSAADRATVDGYFDRELFPVLTPLAVDSGHPFPRLPNLSFSLLLELFDPASEETKLAVVQVPGVLSRFLRLPPLDDADRTFRFVLSSTLR